MQKNIKYLSLALLITSFNQSFTASPTATAIMQAVIMALTTNKPTGSHRSQVENKLAKIALKKEYNAATNNANPRNHELYSKKPVSRRTGARDNHSYNTYHTKK